MTQSPLQSSSCVGLLGMAGVEPTGISQSLLFSKFTLMDLFVGRQTSLFPRTLRAPDLCWICWAPTRQWRNCSSPRSRHKEAPELRATAFSTRFELELLPMPSQAEMARRACGGTLKKILQLVRLIYPNPQFCWPQKPPEPEFPSWGQQLFPGKYPRAWASADSLSFGQKRKYRRLTVNKDDSLIVCW